MIEPKDSLAPYCAWWCRGGKCPSGVSSGQLRMTYGNPVTGAIPKGAGQAERRVGKGPKGGGRGRTQILRGGAQNN